MKNHYSLTPWGLRLGILGLALSASPLSMNCAYAKAPSVKAGAAKSDSVVLPQAPDAALDPLDKGAAARIPEGRVTVTTIEGALEAAYRNNTELKEYQAQLRSRDEGVPQALAGWRPTVYANASMGGEKDIKSGDIKDSGDGGVTTAQSGSNFSTAAADITLQQNLFNGGKTVAETCRAENAVLTARAQLADKEREVLFAAVRAYFEVIAKTSELEYRKSTELAFRKTLEATQDKFNVGEETRTSIAQAQADLANAIAQRDSTEAQLLAAEATFEQVTGARPGKLKKPGDLSMLPSSLKEAIEFAKKNNPAILATLYQERVDRQAIKVSDADLLPKVDLQASIGRQAQNTKNTYSLRDNTKTNDFTTAQKVSVALRVPIYEGGEFRARSRGLRETAEQRRIMIETKRREIIQKLVAAWEVYISSKANIKSYETQVKANEVALEGTRQEMLVGSKILLDVLNAQRLLVQSQLNLVQAEQQFYQAAYDILSNMGRLNALDMKLKVKRYNTLVHYQDVRNSW